MHQATLSAGFAIRPSSHRLKPTPAITVVMMDMNTRPMRKLGVSRADLLESLERPALKPLPAAEYEYAEWKLVHVGIDYRVGVENFYCSVPHALMRQQVGARITTGTVEIFHKGKRVAAHQRRYGGARRHGTLPEHMPPSHRNYAQRSPERFPHWGASIGPETEGLVIAIWRAARTRSRASAPACAPQSHRAAEQWCLQTGYSGREACAHSDGGPPFVGAAGGSRGLVDGRRYRRRIGRLSRGKP